MKRLAEQSTSDFQFTMMAMKEMGQSFRAQASDMSQRMEAMGREMGERFNQLAGRMKLQEQRVSAVLRAVDNALAVYEDHVQALEGKVDSAPGCSCCSPASVE